jgi:hypothetical protein
MISINARLGQISEEKERLFQEALLRMCLNGRQLVKLGNHYPEDVVHISLVIDSIST